MLVFIVRWHSPYSVCCPTNVTVYTLQSFFLPEDFKVTQHSLHQKCFHLHKKLQLWTHPSTGSTSSQARGCLNFSRQTCQHEKPS